jgi:predicted transcriptional regulator
MSPPISVRLDPEVRQTLESEARAQGIGLASYLRQLAAQAARDVRRARIRAGSAAVARHVASDPDERDFMADWGTPAAEERSGGR